VSENDPRITQAHAPSAAGTSALPNVAGRGSVSGLPSGCQSRPCRRPRRSARRRPRRTPSICAPESERSAGRRATAHHLGADRLSTGGVGRASQSSGVRPAAERDVGVRRRHRQSRLSPGAAGPAVAADADGGGRSTLPAVTVVSRSGTHPSPCTGRMTSCTRRSRRAGQARRGERARAADAGGSPLLRRTEA